MGFVGKALNPLEMLALPPPPTELFSNPGKALDQLVPGHGPQTIGGVVDSVKSNLEAPDNTTKALLASNSGQATQDLTSKSLLGG